MVYHGLTNHHGSKHRIGDNQLVSSNQVQSTSFSVSIPAEAGDNNQTVPREATEVEILFYSYI
jgi:hypothetical protein